MREPVPTVKPGTRAQGKRLTWSLAAPLHPMHDSIGSCCRGVGMTMVDVPGPEQASASHLVPVSVVQLHPEEAVFAGMLRGWDAQMSARALSVKTRESRLSTVRRFMLFASEYPWQW